MKTPHFLEENGGNFGRNVNMSKARKLKEVENSKRFFKILASRLTEKEETKRSWDSLYPVRQGLELI